MPQGRKRQRLGSASHSLVKIQHLLSLVVSPTVCWSGIHEGIDVPKSFDNDPPSHHSTRLKGICPFNGYCVCYAQLILPRWRKNMSYFGICNRQRDKVENLLVGVYPGKRLSSSFASREPVVFSEPMKMILHRRWWWFRQVRYPTVNCKLAISHL